MSRPLSPSIFLSALIALGGCGKEPVSGPTPVQPPVVAAPKLAQVGRPAQEVAFIRQCLAVGLRPTILLKLEGKALAQANGQAKASGPTKAQLQDIRNNFSASATELTELAASPAAGRRAPLAQLLAEARTKQAANCSRLPDELVHGEAVGLMMLEFIKITAEAPNYQEADRRAGDHFKQIWPNLINLPVQQKAAMEAILKAEQEFQQVIISIDKEPDLRPIQRDAITGVIRSLEARAKNTANLMTPASFYETLIGHQFRPNAGRLEAGEMVKLEILEQKIVGHCIVSLIRLDLRGNQSGQTASLNLSVVHKTYADGRPVRLLVLEK